MNSLGCSIDSYALFVPRAGAVTVGLGAPQPVMQTLPRDLRVGCYDVVWKSEGNLALTLARGERRSLRSGQDAAVPVSVHSSGDEQVEIANALSVTLQGAVLLVNRTALAIGSVPPGSRTYTLGSADSGESATRADTGLEEILAAVREHGSLQQGIWLVAGTTTEYRRQDGGQRQKVRDTIVYLVEVERNARAI